MDELPDPVNLRKLPERKRSRRAEGTFLPGSGGRPSKIEVDDEVRSRIIRFIQMGATYNRAALAAGVGLSTFKQWRRYAKEGKEPYATFWEEIQEAEAFAEMRLLGLWSRAAENDWRAARDLMRVRFRQDWNVDALTAADGELVELEEPITTVEHLSAIAAAMEEAGIQIVEAADG